MITVLTTVRNGMPFLSECMESVRNQSFRDFVHVIVDDGSTDSTLEFLESANNSSCHVIASAPIGRGSALNIGWKSSDADIIAILDADDVASPVWLAEMVKIMEANPSIGVLTCRGMLKRERLDVIKPNLQVLSRLGVGNFMRTNPVHHSGTLIRRSVLEQEGGYDESRVSLFDYALWVNLLENNHQIWRVDSGYIFKRIHDRQHFEIKNRLDYLMGCFKLRRRLSLGQSSIKYYIIPYLMLAYGFLPQQIRKWLRGSSILKDVF